MTRSDDELLQRRLDYRFSKTALLERALTHSSVLPEMRAPRGGPSATSDPSDARNNEQLEFLGDAVLELIASEYLLATFPEWSEGQLSKSRSRIVNAGALEAAARRLGLGEHLRLGRGEEKTGGRAKPALLADAFEAVVGAIYLDGGLAAAREMLRHSLLEHTVEEGGEGIAESDHKSALQEFLQGRGESPAEYRLACQSGPDHQRVFEVEVWVKGECLASGAGSTKKDAEQRAARIALERLTNAEAGS
jgi:ribonuclease-3